MAVLVVGEHHFKTQKDCRKYIQDLLKLVGITKSVKNSNTVAFEFLTQLFQRHPDKDRKLMNMVDCSIERNAMNKKAYTLFVIDCQGNRQDISYNVCISGKDKSNKQELMSAMRNAIQYQIDYFKANVVNRRLCENCNKTIKGVSHVHHSNVEFDDISKDFLQTTKLVIPSEFDECKRTFVRIFNQADNRFVQEWQEFHQQHATLQQVCQMCNLSTLKRKPQMIKRETI
jgi:hypothetical protein